MSYTIARYALWVLLCIPVAVLGFRLVGDLLDTILQDSRKKQAERDAKTAKEQKRLRFEEQYRKQSGTGN